MPAIDDPFGLAASLPGQVAALRATVKDLSVNRTYSPNTLTVGAGGLTDLGSLAVTGATTLTGGVTGPVAATGAISGASLTVTGATTLTGGVTGPVAATGALSGTTITGTGAISGASLAVSGATTLTGATTLSGGVSGPVASNGQLSGTSLYVGTGGLTAGAISGTTVAATGTATVGGDINLTGDLYTPHGKITPVVSGYVAAYINTDGRLGASVSAQRFKQDITAHTYTLDQIALIQIVSYRLRTAVAMLGTSARVEVGVIAEQLVSAGMPEFVVYGDDGQCLTVAYERLDLVAIAGVQLLYTEIINIKKRLTAAGI